MSLVRSPTHDSVREDGNAVKKATRQKGPPQKDWALVEPSIEIWYIQEERSQKEILELLKGRHGLVVKPNVLKTRLRKLNLRKNDKKEEREAAERHLKQCADQGVTPPFDIKINGKHPHWDRVYRHSRKEPGVESFWLTKGSEWHAQVSRICLKATPDDHRSEIALIEVRSYWATLITKPASAVTLKTEQDNAKSLPDPSTLRIGFLTGLRLLNKGQERDGKIELRRTREEASTVFKMQEPDLTKEILSLFSARAWTLHPTEFLSVAKFLLGMSIEHLGLQHPLSKVLDVFVALVAAGTLEAFEVLPEQALKVMVDLAEAERSRVKLESSYLHSVEVDLISKVRSRLGPVAVRKLVQKKYFHYRSTLGDRSRHTLTMRMDLARTHLDEAKEIDGQENPHEKQIAERKGEEALSKIVAQGEKFPGDRYRIGSYLVAAQELGRYYFAKQDFPNAHKYYIRAVIWATEKLGKYHSYTGLLLTEVRALRKLVSLGMVDVPAAEEELWQTHIAEVMLGQAVETVEWEPYHAEIDLDDNLELVEPEDMPQNVIDAISEPLDQSQGQTYEGSSSQAQAGVQSESLDYLDYQAFEHDFMQQGGSSFTGNLDVLDRDLSGDVHFASEMTFEGLINASEQDLLDFLPADPSQNFTWFEEFDGGVEI